MAYLNYNVALLKTIREPLLEGLTPVRDALLAVVAGTLPAHQVQVAGALEAAGNLQMVGRPSLVLSLRTLSSALTRLQKEHADWELGKAQNVAKTGADLVDQVIQQIRAAERGQPMGPRDLMRAWSALASAADLPLPSAADLFDGDADIDASRFSAVDAQILRETAVPHLEKFTSAINLLRAPVQESGWVGMLSDMEEVFDWACAVRHRLGFHAYWCGARARIAWESLSGFPSQDTSGKARLEAFTRAMHQASLELRKFSEDARRTRPDSLIELMRPLLTPWPEGWTARRQSLSDAVSLFKLDDFWRQTQEGASPAERQGSLAPDVSNLARQLLSIKNGWINQSGTSTPDFAPVARSLSTFIPSYRMHAQVRDGLAEPGEVLVGALSQLASHLDVSRPVPAPAFFEVATLLLVVEDTLGLQDEVDLESLPARADLVSRRVEAALRADPNLRALPRPVWSRRRLSRMASLAVSSAVAEIKSDLSFVVDIVDEFYLRDTAAARPQYKEIREKILMDAQVLRTLGQTTAATILDAVYKDLVVMTHPTPPSQDSKEFYRLTQALAGVQAFLDSFALGDHDASRLLDPALTALSLSHSLDRGLSDFSPAVVAPSSVQPSEKLVVEKESESTVASMAGPEPTSLVGSSDAVSNGKTQEELEDQQAQVAETFRLSKPWTDKADDRELVDAFVEETLAVFDRLEASRIACIEQPSNRDSLIDLRRQYHTLKGSGRMSGLWGVAEYAAQVETRLNEARDAEEDYSDSLDRVIEVSAGRLSEFLGELSREGWVRIGPLHQRELMGVIASSYPQVPDLAAEQAEAERLEAERLAAEQAESERLAAEHLAAEQAEAARLEAERLAAEQLAAEQAEAARLEAEQAEAERLEAERLAAEQLAAEQAEAERLEAEQAEAERLAAEQLAAEQAEAEQSRLDGSLIDVERVDFERPEAQAQSAALGQAETLDSVMADDAAMEDILLDLRTHRDNMRNVMGGRESFDVSMLNWSVHTLASLARGLGHERFRAFCKTLERKIEGDVDAQQSGVALSSARTDVLLSLSAVVLEKTESLLTSPRAPLDWDSLDEAAEATLFDLEDGSPFAGEQRPEEASHEDKKWEEVHSRLSSIVDHFNALQSIFHELSKSRK